MPNAVKTCAGCGTQLPKGAAFCLKCGLKQPSDGSEPVQAPATIDTMQWAANAPKQKPRKTWIESVPGFRTGVRWKMTIAVCLYIAIALQIIGAIANLNHNSQSNPRAAAVATVALAATATPEPTVEPQVLIGRLDAMWAQGRWWEAISALEQLQQSDPGALDFKDKLYAAHYFNGKDLLSKGIRNDAATQFAIANQIDPTRTEAQAELLALTPTPVPPTPVPAPTLTPRIGDQIAKGNWGYGLVEVKTQKTVTWSAFGNKTSAKGTWLVIIMAIMNGGDKSMPINSWDFELKDDQGRTYSMDTVTSSMFSDFNKLSSLGDTFPPGVGDGVGMLYDVNPDAKGFRLYLKQADNRYFDLVEK